MHTLPAGKHHRSQEKRAARNTEKGAQWAALEAQFGKLLRPHPPPIVASYPGGYGRGYGYYGTGSLRGVTYGNRNHRSSGLFLGLIKKFGGLKKSPNGYAPPLTQPKKES